MGIRWPWVTVPGALFLALWILRGVAPAFDFVDMGQLFQVANRSAYQRLAALCLIGVAVVLIAMLLRPKD